MWVSHAERGREFRTECHIREGFSMPRTARERKHRRIMHITDRDLGVIADSKQRRTQVTARLQLPESPISTKLKWPGRSKWGAVVMVVRDRHGRRWVGLS